MKKSILYLIIIIPFIFTGCSSLPGGDDAAQEPEKIQNGDGSKEQKSRAVEEDLDPSERLLVSKAREDLANLLGIAIDEIEFVSFRPVVWGDGSLGCAKPGMAYKQVLVDGYSILLKVDDIYYDYHGGGVREPFLCETRGEYNSLTPVPLHPADQ